MSTPRPTLDLIVEVLKDLRASESGLQYMLRRQAGAALMSAVDWDPRIAVSERPAIAGEAIARVIEGGGASVKKLRSEYSAAVGRFVAKPMRNFAVATSLFPELPVGSLGRRMGDVRFTFRRAWPKWVVRGREGLKGSVSDEELSPRKSTFVIGRVQARTPNDAFHRTSAALGALRGMWSLGMTFRSFRVFGGSSDDPLTKLRLGRIHTVHLEEDDSPT